MSFPVRARWAAAAVLAVAAGAAAASRIAPIEPSLDVVVRREMRGESYDLWDVFVTAHGGEVIDEVAVEVVSGPAHLVGGAGADRIPNLKSGWMRPFRVQLDNGGAARAELRVLQKGRVSRTYPVHVGDEP
jgi:hypothetical protein